MDHRVGSIVPYSGIYDVIHHDGHAQKHQVTCIAGRRFPPCRTCREGVSFRLSGEPSIHIEKHQLFG
jgi:hypothetical protein